MSDYIPTIDDLRQAYVQAQLGADGYSAEAREAEFDRALAEIVRAEREQAWDEGHGKGLGSIKPQRNPYRGDQS